MTYTTIVLQPNQDAHKLIKNFGWVGHATHSNRQWRLTENPFTPEMFLLVDSGSNVQAAQAWANQHLKNCPVCNPERTHP